MEYENDQSVDISGLGSVNLGAIWNSVIKRNPSMNNAQGQAAINAAVKQAMEQHLRNSLMTRAQKSLLANAKNFSTDLKAAIERGDVRFVDEDLYVRYEITSTGDSTTQLIKQNTDQKVGLTSFQNNKFEYPIAITKIRVAYGQSGSITDPALIAYSNIGTTPAALLNGELAVQKNGTGVNALPVSRFFNIGGSYGSIQGSFDSLTLESPINYKENETFGLALTMPSGSVLGTTAGVRYFIEVRLMGVSLRRL